MSLTNRVPAACRWSARCPDQHEAKERAIKSAAFAHGRVNHAPLRVPRRAVAQSTTSISAASRALSHLTPCFNSRLPIWRHRELNGILYSPFSHQFPRIPQHKKTYGIISTIFDMIHLCAMAKLIIPIENNGQNLIGFAIVQISMRAKRNALPELHLRRDFLWLGRSCRSPHNRICALPLCARYENRTHRSFRRDIKLQSPQMRLLSRECDTWPCINGKLYHVVPVVKQELPELRRPLSFSLGQHRQVEADH